MDFSSRGSSSGSISKSSSVGQKRTLDFMAKGDEDNEGPEDEEEEDVNFPTVQGVSCPLQECGKLFHSSWSLTRHIRTHTGEKPFRCEVCGKEFVQRCSLKRHFQTHSNVKQYACDFDNCDKRFKVKEYLDVHKRIHQKPLQTESTSNSSGNGDIEVDESGATPGQVERILIEQLCRRILRNSIQHEEHVNQLTKENASMTVQLKKCADVLEMIAKQLPELETEIVEIVTKSKDMLQKKM